VALGIRPEAFEDAEFASPDLPTLDVEVAVLEELGSDAYVFFQSGARRVPPELLQLDDDAALVPYVGALVCARVDPQSRARVGDRLRLAVNPRRFHFFDLATGVTLLSGTEAKRADVPAPAGVPD
jgi:multiple sugar transport system ATP-binding protein